MAASDSRWISATLAQRLHFKTFFIRGYKKVARSEVGWVGVVGHHVHFFSQKIAGCSRLCGPIQFSKKKIAKHLQSLRKKYQKNQHEARSAMSLGRIVQNIVGSPYLLAEPWTTSRLCGWFKFRKYLGPPSYSVKVTCSILTYFKKPQRDLVVVWYVYYPKLHYL
jgi:hypothetical protein